MFRSLNQNLSFKQQKDPGVESDFSTEFSLSGGFGDPSASEDSEHIIDSSGPFWGPNIRVQQTPALTAQKLELWRTYSEQPKAINAAAELDKLYASLPDDKIDLTLRDMVEARKPSPRTSPKVTPAKDGESMTLGAILGRKTKEAKKPAEKEDGAKFKPKNKVHNSTSMSLPFKLSSLSTKCEKSTPAAVPSENPDRKSSLAPFRSEENTSSRRWFSAGCSTSVPADIDKAGNVTAAASDRETSGSAEFLTLKEQLLQSPDGPKSSSVRQLMQQSHACCICSSSNLIFKTRCTVCGKLYCSKCAKEEMGNSSEGRKCKKNCVGRPSHPRFTRKSAVGCWPLFGFSNNHATVAEATAMMRGEKPETPRLQELDLHRRAKSSSYPPSRSPARSPPKRSPVEAPPRRTPQRLPSIPVGLS
ncbi:hypothetical protein R1flu_025447 [Riccia fluitans]|uniref:FYVE-type domain-containing protein n=1 Tax=Riccia fluitans TaxID=41844 RepID=A0ABD1XXS5_9MARC